MSFFSISLSLLPGFFSAFSYIFLFIILLLDYKQAPIVFLNLALLILINESISGAYLYAQFKYLIFFLFFIKSGFYFYKNFIKYKVVLSIFILYVLIVLHSFLFSYSLVFSVLKSTLWVTFVLSFILYFSRLDINERGKVLYGLYLALISFFYASSVLVFFPEIGYYLNGTGFQGLTNQPQVFGCISALLGVISLMFYLNRNKFIYVLNFIFSLFFIYLSESRTAGLALLFSSLILFFKLYSSFFLNKNKGDAVNISVISTLFFGILTFIFINFNAFKSYIYKRNDSSFSSISDSSRGGLVDQMLLNLNNYWSTGIGFGIPSDFDFSNAVYAPIINVPISLPIEKGVLFISIFEEFGVFFGMSVFLLILFILFRNFWFNKNSYIILFIFASNISENTFFSVGGLGMLLTLFLCLSVSISKRGCRNGFN